MDLLSSSSATLQEARTALQAVHALTLLHHVLEDTAGQAVLALLRELTDPEPDASRIATSYSRAFEKLAVAADSEAVPHIADAWQAYLIARIIDDSNVWSTQVERYGLQGCSTSMLAQARRDLRVLQCLFNLLANQIWQLTQDLVTTSLPMLRDAWVPWYDLAPVREDDEHVGRHTLSRYIAESKDWGEVVEMLAAHWSRHGTGPLARYAVLRWHGSDGGLQGVSHPDPIQLHQLIGYEREQARLRANTERFLAGLPAHHVLLYGPPGTGKSSTIKALVNAYAEQGLRLVEVRKEYVNDLLAIVNQLRGRAPHYVLFVDDLSFEEHETAYKVLKVLLEGTAEARPENVLIYATSNRLNLIRESFSDRGKPTEDVHWRDTMDEKHSLAHRFGLRITFMTPDQAHYLNIVEGLARQRHIDLPKEELYERALHWERQHAGRSGRVARQFIDELEAEWGYAQNT
jgi:predicted AAA+ superfamily ATPase